jgi:hypothetical protein
MEMDYVLPEHVYVRRDSMDLIALSLIVLMIVIHKESARILHVIVMKDLQEIIANIEHVKRNVAIRVNVLKMEHVNATKVIQE